MENIPFMKKEKRFDMNKCRLKPTPFFVFLERFLSWGWLLFDPVKIDKKDIKGIKGPVLCLSNHASMIDFPICVKALKPINTTWVASIEEFDGRKWLFESMGMIPKRKFTHSTSHVKHIFAAIKKEKSSVTIYPEARFVMAGINEQLDGALGKLAKRLGVPVLMIMMHGNFLRSPQWCKHPYRDIRPEARIYQLISPEETKTLSEEELQKRIEEAFNYDDYKWQYDNKLAMKSKNRALNIHKILYKCPHCGAEFKTESDGTSIWCNECGHKWVMDEYSRLHATEGETYFEHVPDWYRWERSEVRKEVEAGTYRFEDAVSVHHHINTKTMRVEGTVRCVHDHNGFVFSGKFDNGEESSLHKNVASMYSLHIEYDFRKKGAAFDIATENDTYFMYPVTATNPLTKLHFAVEELYNYYIREGNPLPKSPKAE